MRIGIDGTPLTTPFHSGTRHYAEQLLSALVHLDDKNEYVIFTPGVPLYSYKNNFKIVPIPKHIPILKRQLYLPLAVKREKVDVFHYLEPFGAFFLHHPRIITTIHDLDLESIYPKANSSRNFIRRWYPEFIRGGALKNTHTFIAVSESTRNELQRYIKKKRLVSNIVVIYEACHPEFRILNRKKQNKNNYFLCMGDFSPRKNIPNVLEAFSKFQHLVKSSCRLKIVISSLSPKKDFMKKTEELGITPYVDIVENASLHKLIELYNDALALVYPSLYEGFGIPILEAMACGCPVITSNFGAMKEVAGGAALLVNPEDIQDIFRAMHYVLENKKMTSALQQAGLERAKQFSWKQTARKTLAVYKSVYMS